MTARIREATLDDADDLFALASDFATSLLPSAPPSTPRLPTSCPTRARTSWWRWSTIGLLGFDHPTFFANGRVAWVEELMVDAALRRGGVGRSLMAAFETWARRRGCRLVTLATRRAASFYAALGYERSATYFRRSL